MSVQPGWYIDPADRDTRRYWDGEGWIGAPIPADATPPAGPPPPEPTPPSASAPPAGGTTAPGPPAAPGRPGQPPHPPGYAPQPGPGPWPGPGQPGPRPHGPGQPGPGPQGWGPPPQGWGPPLPGQPYPPWAGRPPEPRPHGLPLASFGARLVARLIDLGIVFLLNALVNGWFVWQYVQEISPLLREAARRVDAGDRSTEPLPPPGQRTDGLLVVILLIAVALWIAYEVPSMASRGQSFGKRVMNVRAVPVEADQPLGVGRALRRWSTLGLPTLLWFCCGFGLLLQLVDALSPLFDHPLRQALHDKRAQTVVVQVPRGTPQPTPQDRTDPPGDTP
ncbi:RDD family protein [Micromonospora mirobrigensis]|uniref:RDD family protein n=1 Tax=Micromonospora mirobrigensis TaxID=262898 RepID=A0A1C4ZR15_9ACTN|nr:RDD family protein [Micromonospora mirobrigensis]SCF35415.1 RDD family protein [Micromonospora mirobrigensis]